MTSQPPGQPRMTAADLAYLERLAAAAADSGLYGSGANVKAQLLMKLIYGRDLGIPVSAALSAIDIYDGRMELSANLIAALLEAHPHYAYAILESTNERCELEFFKDERSLGTAKFDRADATTAGLADTEYYRQYPSDMFFARAMTRGARRHCPGLGRGVPIYATGELAKRTPQPTRASSNGNGAGVVRAAASDATRIRLLAERAGIDDAELFNVLVSAGGGARVDDPTRATNGLSRALELLPLTLVRTVCETLRERVVGASAETATSDDPPVAARASERGT